MIEYQELLIKIRRLTSDRINLGRKKVWLPLMLKNSTENLVSNLQNIYYLFNSLYNLVNFDLLNYSKIFHDNENKTL